MSIFGVSPNVSTGNFSVTNWPGGTSLSLLLLKIRRLSFPNFVFIITILYMNAQICTLIEIYLTDEKRSDVKILL